MFLHVYKSEQTYRSMFSICISFSFEEESGRGYGKGQIDKGWGCKIIYNFDNVYQLKAHLLLLGDIMQLSSANVDFLS